MQTKQPLVPLKRYMSDNSVSVLAKGIGMSPSFLVQIATGLRPMPVKYCNSIERETKGAVTRKDLRPHDWQDYWPELGD